MESDDLNIKQIQEDLDFLDQKLKQLSSYQGLNGYSYQNDFKEFKNDQNGSSISKKDFQIFLTNVIGQIGDRHSYVKGIKFSRTKYLPFMIAPLEDKVVTILEQNPTSKFKEIWNKSFGKKIFN